MKISTHRCTQTGHIFLKSGHFFAKSGQNRRGGWQGRPPTPLPASCGLKQGSRNKVSATLLKKETLAQVFSCEFCEIFKGTFFIEHLWASTSDNAFIDILHYYSAPVKYIFRQVSVQANINLIWYVHRQIDSNINKFSKCFIFIFCINRSSRPEVFCKKRCSQKFRKIHKKTPVPQPLF